MTARRVLLRIASGLLRALGFACVLAAALCLLVGRALAQGPYATIQREQKLSALQGNLGPLGNDYRFGVSVADLGDFDGDGVHDIVVGAHRANIGGGERGAIYLLLLQADGKVKTRLEISSLAGGLQGPIDDHDRFGVSVASLGDLDLDGVTDLAVGAYRDDDGGFDRGALYILFLNADGTVKSEQKISSSAGGFTGLLDTEDSFGWCVEPVSDLDGDGVPDLLVGASRDDGDSVEVTFDFGGLYLLFMNRDGTVKSHSKIGAGSQGMGLALRPGDRFGSDVVVLGDADGDGFVDLAVGAFGEDPLKCGKVFILHLGPGGALSWFSEIGLGTGGFTGALGKGDRFGMALAAEDVDGDGLADLFVGAPGDDDGGAGAGALWLCLMNADGSVRAQEKVSPDFGGFGGVLRPSDNFGVSLDTVGDIDHDGSVDLVVGAYQDDDGGFDHGAAWVLFRAASGLPVADFTSQPGTGALPLTVSFIDRSSGDVSSHLWDFGDGQTSTQIDPQHTYTAAGIFPVSLTVAGPSGSDTLRRERAVVVSAPSNPVAEFAAAPTSGAAPLGVAFTDLSQGLVDTWLWDFGDGTTSTQRHPQHDYTQPGAYTVGLTAVGPGGSSSFTAIDLIQVVEPEPVASFVGEALVGAAPLLARFTDTSTLNVTGWTWDFGDGTTSSVRNPAHEYTSPGQYDVSLSVTSAGGSDSILATGAVVAYELPVAGAQADVLAGVLPLTVTFTDLSTGGVDRWEWDFGDGTSSNEQHPVHDYLFPGSYTVTLQAGHAWAEDVTTLSIDVQWPVPQAAFAVDSTAGDAPLTVTFTDQSTQVDRWTWDFGDGTGSSARSPVHEYVQPGLYTVTLRAGNAWADDVTTRVIDATWPRPRARFAADVTEGPAPLRVSFTDLSVGNVTAWEWDFGDGTASYEANPVHTYRDEGVYTVRFRAYGPGGFMGVVRRDFIRVSKAPGGEPAPVPRPGGKAAGIRVP